MEKSSGRKVLEVAGGVTLGLVTLKLVGWVAKKVMATGKAAIPPAK